MIRNFTNVGVILVLATLLVGCNQPANAPGGSLSLVEPADGQHFEVGQLITVRSLVGAADGASSMELLVNGQPVRTDQPKQSLRVGYVWQPWQPAEPGSYTLQTRILTASGTTINSQRITIVVGGAAVSPSVTPPTPVAVTAEGTITPTLTTTPTAFQVPSGPMVTAPQDDNCRFGPGLAHSVTGYLMTGQSAPIVGRNAETTWWMIVILGGGPCWIWDDVVTVSGDTSGVPVVTAPAAPTDTPTPQAEPAAVPIPISPSGSLTCRSTVTLTWQPVNQPNGVDHYEWQVTGLAPTKQGATADSSDEFIVACGASYQWRVRAVDGNGVPGPYSAAMTFTIQ